MKHIIIILAGVLCACHNAASLPEPSGPFEPLNGPDQASSSAVSPISLVAPMGERQAAAIQRAMAELKH